MSGRASAVVIGVLALLSFSGVAAEQTTRSAGLGTAGASGKRLQFVTCPIVRDTKTQPCWLAQYEGETYYLGQQGGVANDFHPPQLNHLALVEGAVGQGRVCGGVPLTSVKVSVLLELTPACNQILPAEDGFDAPPPVPAPRGGAAPTWLKTDGPGNVTFYFDFDNDFFSLHATNALISLAEHIKSASATRVTITGYRGATRLSNGTLMTERAGLATERANKVRDTLAGLRVAPAVLTATGREQPEPADGVNDPWRRRVVVAVR